MDGPKLSKGFEPLIEGFERMRRKSIEATLSLRANLDESRVFQYAKVFGDSRLTDGERVDEVTDGSFAASQHLEDVPAMRLGQDVEHGESRHVSYITTCSYECQGIYKQLSV
jgi:hypothetical protein